LMPIARERCSPQSGREGRNVGLTALGDHVAALVPRRPTARPAGVMSATKIPSERVIPCPSTSMSMVDAIAKDRPDVPPGRGFPTLWGGKRKRSLSARLEAVFRICGPPGQSSMAPGARGIMLGRTVELLRSLEGEVGEAASPPHADMVASARIQAWRRHERIETLDVVGSLRNVTGVEGSHVHLACRCADLMMSSSI
jgi:hypothetical protein